MATPNDPYQPPQAPLREVSAKGPGSPVKAVVLGALTDIGATFVVSIVLNVLAAISLGEGATDTEALRETLTSGAWQIVGMILGSLCTVLGGYVAARIANRGEYRYAAICGFASLVLSELLASGSDIQSDFGMRLAGWIVTIPLAMLGARLRLNQKAREAEAKPPKQPVQTPDA